MQMPMEAQVECSLCGASLFPLRNDGMPFMDEDFDEAICLQGTPFIEEMARLGECDSLPFHRPTLVWEK